MKILWEPGDYAEVEDNYHAGEAAACTVQLISEQRDGKWLVEVTHSHVDNMGKQYHVEGRFLHPS
jgi:hypothetical protein